MENITVRFEHGKQPLYEQLYHHIKNEIQQENLKSGEKLPSKRRLSEHLKISLNTVENAYGQLIAEGYIESRQKSGYYVCRFERGFSDNEMSRNERKHKIKEQYDFDFSPAGVDLKSFPYSLWRKLFRDALADCDAQDARYFAAGDPCGEYELREQIARYLHGSRGVNCQPDQIVVGAGGDFCLQLLSQLLGKGRRFAMENPVYNKAYKILEGMGNTVVPTPLDRSGISLSALRESNADIAYITPSHQFPLGIIMPINRRMQLYAWANETGNRYIVEDDYDSEFRYSGRPIPALQGIDSRGKVIYLGTFSKSIAPSIRISYMVLPHELKERLDRDFGFYSSTVSRIEQRVLIGFLKGGHFERHLNRMRKLYGRRRETLVAALRKMLPQAEASGDHSGLYLLMHMDGGRSERELDTLALAYGVKLYPLSDYYFGNGKNGGKPAFLMGYANLDETEIERGVDRLAEAWK